MDFVMTVMPEYEEAGHAYWIICDLSLLLRLEWRRLSINAVTGCVENPEHLQTLLEELIEGGERHKKSAAFLQKRE